MTRLSRTFAMQSNHAMIVSLFGGEQKTRKTIKNYTDKLLSSKTAWKLFAIEGFPNRGYFTAECIRTNKVVKVSTSRKLLLIDLLHTYRITKEYPDLRAMQDQVSCKSWSLISGELTEEEAMSASFVTKEDVGNKKLNELDCRKFGFARYEQHAGLVFKVPRDIFSSVFDLGPLYKDREKVKVDELAIISVTTRPIYDQEYVFFTEDSFYNNFHPIKKEVTYTEICLYLLDKIFNKFPSANVETVKRYYRLKNYQQEKEIFERQINNRAVIDKLRTNGVHAYIANDVLKAMNKRFKYTLMDADSFVCDTLDDNLLVHGMFARLCAPLGYEQNSTINAKVRVFSTYKRTITKEIVQGYLGLNEKTVFYNRNSDAYYYGVGLISRNYDAIDFAQSDFEESLIPEFERLGEEVFFDKPENSFIAVDHCGISEMKIHYAYFFADVSFVVTFALERRKNKYSLA